MTTTTPPTRHGRSPAALYLTRAYDWRDDALCAGQDGETWFPVVHTKGWQEKLEQAKKVCARCPVTAECLAYALKTGQKAGVWGGLSEAERQELRPLPETQVERCWDNRPWIEAQLAAGVSRREIASQLNVDLSSLRRAIDQFAAEREHTAAQQAAASKAVNAA